MPQIALPFVLFLICAGIGSVLTRLLPAYCRYRAPAGPVLGFCVVSVTCSIAYRWGADLHAYSIAAVVLAVVCVTWSAMASRWPERDKRGHALLGIGVGVVVLCFCLAPAWTGGARFTAFQANQWDQFGYLSMVSVMRSHDYGTLMAWPAGPDLPTLARQYLNARPAVALVLGALGELLDVTSADGSYGYRALLQFLMFPTALFAWRNLFGGALGAALLFAAAATLGFPLQYVFDINAWSQLAAMPVALMGLCLLTLAAEPPEGAVGTRNLLPGALGFAAIAAALFYLYPEIVPVYGVMALAVTIARLARSDRRASLATLGQAGLGLGLGLLLCLAYREATFDFLVGQANFAASVEVDWWRYYDSHLIHDVPSDMALSGIGLYFVLPPRSTDLWAAIVWRIPLYVLAMGIFAATARILKGPGTVETRRLRLLALATLVSLTVAVLLALTGRIWVAGKVLAMVAPVLFLVLCAPLSCARPWSWRLPALAMAVLYIGFGVARPFAALSPTGVHYPLPYPGAQLVQLKESFDWDLAGRRAQLMNCSSLVVDLADEFFRRYVETYLTDLDLNWTSARSVNSYYGIGADLGLPPQIPDPDCAVVADTLWESPDTNVIDLGESRGPD